VGGSANVREGGVPGGVVDSAAAALAQKEVEKTGSHLTHMPKVRYSDGQWPFPPANPPHFFVP